MGCAWWSRVMVLLLAVGCIAAGCGEDRPPFREAQRGQGRDAGAREEDSASRDASSPPTPGRRPDVQASDGGSAPRTSDATVPRAPASRSQACASFDARVVHLWGLGGVGPLTTVTQQLDGIANELDIDRVCPYSASVTTPKIRPSDNRVLYRSTAFTQLDGGAYLNEPRLFEMVFDSASGELDEREVPTPGCEGEGISTFHLHPMTGEVLFNCRVPRCKSAVPFLQETDACYAGPWYKSDGSLAVSRGLYAVNAKGVYLVSFVGFLGLGLLDPDAGDPETTEPTSVSYEGEPLPEREDMLLTQRAHGDGFWIVVGKYGGQRRRISIGSDAVAVVDGVYPLADGEEVTGWVAAGTIANSWALDAAGALYEDLGTKVVKSDLDGKQMLVYEKPPPPSYSRADGIYGGVSAYLVTGP